ncbi:MAG TPA: transposase [Chloroflexota bacterium]|nr:transposase [Chloroflexota bacterium]
MTLPNTYSWSPVGKRLYVPYEAPQGRRVNAAGALFHSSGRFEFLTRARAPKTKRKAISSRAEGLEASELGVLNAEVLIAFIWHIAGRPESAPEDWRRDKPLLRPPSVAGVIVLDNYSVHVGKRFQQERERWRAADIDLFFLPSYSPELSGIEPLWRDVKQHRLRRLSRDKLLDLKRDVDAALAEKASSLISANSSTGTA